VRDIKNMFFAKITAVLTIAAFVACTDHHASSYATFSQHITPEISHHEPEHHESSHGTSYASVHNYVDAGHGISFGDHHGHEVHYPDHHPKFNYKYGVEDHHTGDYKSAHESRDGDVVKGEYTLIQPDGKIRTVHYSADKHSGFNAHVSYSGGFHDSHH